MRTKSNLVFHLKGKINKRKRALRMKIKICILEDTNAVVHKNQVILRNQVASLCTLVNIWKNRNNFSVLQVIYVIKVTFPTWFHYENLRRKYRKLRYICMC